MKTLKPAAMAVITTLAFSFGGVIPASSFSVPNAEAAENSGSARTSSGSSSNSVPQQPVDPPEPETPVDPPEPETPVDPPEPETPVDPPEPETPPIVDPISPGETDEPTASVDDIIVNEKARNMESEEAESLFGLDPTAEELIGTRTVPSQLIAETGITEGSVFSIQPTNELATGAIVVVEEVTPNAETGEATITTREGYISDIIVDTNGLVDLSSNLSEVTVVPADDVVLGSYLTGDDAEAARPSWVTGREITENSHMTRQSLSPFAQMSSNHNLVSVPFKADLKKNLTGVEAAAVNGAFESKVKSLIDISPAASFDPRDSVKQMTMELESVAWFDADFEARQAFSGALDKKIADINISFALPGTPVTLTMAAGVNLKSDIAGSGSFRYQYKFNAGQVTGVRFKDKKVSPITDKWVAVSEKKNLSADLAMSSTVNPSTKLGLTMTGVDLSSIAANGDLRGRFTATANNNTLDCTLSGDARSQLNYNLLSWSGKWESGWQPVFETPNVCEGMTTKPNEPIFDPENVVPRGNLRSFLNFEAFGRSGDLDHPISQAELETITSINIDRRFEGNHGYDLEGLQYATNLTSLRSSFSVDKIPDLSGLPKLTTIYFNGASGLTTFPVGAGTFPRLSNLEIRYLTLDLLPEELFAGGQLVDVKISNAENMTALPSSLADNPRLSRLQLSSTGIKALPEDLSGLRSLRSLSLTSNIYLETLPSSLGDVDSLRTLSVGGTSLKSLPETIGNLYALETLYVDSPRFHALPASINNLSALQTLSVTGTPSFDLPTDLSGMVSLKTLRLNEVGLREVPVGVSTLPSLESLYVRNNVIRTLPSFLVDMNQRDAPHTLKWVYILGNPLDSSDPVYIALNDAGVLSTYQN